MQADAPVEPEASTWRAVVDVARAERACVYCGLRGDVGGRLVAVAAVRALLRSQRGMEGEELHETYANLCMSVAAFTDLAEEAAGPAADEMPPAYDNFVACSCCDHWIKRRTGRAHFLFPLQALKLHLLCLPVVAGKTKDARVVQRLAAALACTPADAPPNFFRAAFSPAELALCAQLAAGPLGSVTETVATFVHEENAHSPFLRCAKLSEVVRGARGAR